jgi:hypothetical protein
MQNQILKNCLNYFSYLALFVGTGFISGSIVHSGNIEELPKYIWIGLIGTILFIAGSFYQEFTNNINKTNQVSKPIFLFISLILSIGIGMISGGTQHFTDFPAYSSILIPLGLIVSFLAFKFKNKSVIDKSFYILFSLLLISAILLFLGLNSYAKTISATNVHNHSEGNSKEMESMNFPKIKLNQSNFVLQLNSNSITQSGNNLEIQIKDKLGNIQTNYQENHGAKMHIIAIKKDLSDYQHLHPDYSNGLFKVHYNFEQIGEYKLYADFVINNTNSVLSQDITVTNNTSNSAMLMQDHNH